MSSIVYNFLETCDTTLVSSIRFPLIPRIILDLNNVPAWSQGSTWYLKSAVSHNLWIVRSQEYLKMHGNGKAIHGYAWYVSWLRHLGHDFPWRRTCAQKHEKLQDHLGSSWIFVLKFQRLHPPKEVDQAPGGAKSVGHLHLDLKTQRDDIWWLGHLTFPKSVEVVKDLHLRGRSSRWASHRDSGCLAWQIFEIDHLHSFRIWHLIYYNYSCIRWIDFLWWHSIYLCAKLWCQGCGESNSSSQGGGPSAKLCQ